MPLYPHPLSPGYWRSAAGELKDLRRLVFMALMIAACIVLSHCSIRLGESLSLSVTFLARALCSLVCGPLAVIVFGAAEDTLSFFLSSGGYPYFPGYMLTTITGCMIYALFFYRAKITWRRIILAKLLTNIQNVLLGRHPVQQGLPLLPDPERREKRPVSAVANSAAGLPVSGGAAGDAAPALAPGAAAGRSPALVSDVFTNN